MPHFQHTLRSAHRSVLAHRRPLAAFLAGVAVLASARAVTEPPPSTRTLLVASRDLPSGTVLEADDLRVAEFTVTTVPPGAVAPEVPPVGRVLAAPMGRGEPLTHIRLVDDSLLAGYPGLAITPVRVADVETLTLLDIGTRIDLVATDPGTGAVETLARHVQVVAIPRTESISASPGSGGLLLVAVSPEAASRIAAATVTAYISWALSP